MHDLSLTTSCHHPEAHAHPTPTSAPTPKQSAQSLLIHECPGRALHLRYVGRGGESPLSAGCYSRELALRLRPRPAAGSQRQRSQNQGTPPHPRQRRDPSPCDPNAQAPSTMRRYLDLNLSQTHWYRMGKLRHREAVDLSEAHGKLRRGWEQTPPVAPARGGSPAHSLAPGNLPSQGDSVHGAWSPRGCLGVVLPHSCRATCLVPGGRRQGSRKAGRPHAPHGPRASTRRPLPPSACSPHLRSQREHFQP